ncbi:MAG: tyrosine-type recombinase/integrase [Prevotella sp.]
MEKKTVKFIYSDWRRMKEMLVKESTLSTYSTNTEKHILPVFGNKESISEAEVQQFVFDLIDKGLNIKTVKDILLILRMIVNHGIRMGCMTWSDWNIKLPRPEEKNTIKVFSIEQQKMLMEHLKSHFSFRNLGLYICLCTGIRIGEICALKWDDIHLDSRIIMINRTIERVYIIDKDKKYTKIIIGSPKTGTSRREIPISTELIKILKPIMTLINGNYYVLTNNENPIEPRIYRRHYINTLKLLKLPNIKFHGLRHTFATRCIESNCDYKTVSSILGHANISTTLNLYVHPDIGQKRKCIDKMLKFVK